MKVEDPALRNQCSCLTPNTGTPNSNPHRETAQKGKTRNSLAMQGWRTAKNRSHKEAVCSISRPNPQLCCVPVSFESRLLAAWLFVSSPHFETHTRLYLHKIHHPEPVEDSQCSRRKIHGEPVEPSPHAGNWGSIIVKNIFPAIPTRCDVIKHMRKL